MLDLRKIRKTTDYIEAEYYPEGSAEKGFVRVDLDGKVIKSNKTSYDEISGMYFKKAVSKLRSIAEKDTIPESVCVMWY